MLDGERISTLQQAAHGVQVRQHRLVTIRLRVRFAPADDASVGFYFDEQPALAAARVDQKRRDARDLHQPWSFTGFPVRADSYTPWMMATTRRPSSPVTAGGRLSRIAPITSRN